MALTTTTLGPAAREHRPRDHAAPSRHIDYSLVALVVALAFAGLVMVLSATKGQGPDPALGYATRQGVFAVIGLGVLAVASLVDYRHLRTLAPGLFALSILLLGLVLVIGGEHKGSQAWFQVGPVQFQPSEPSKLALIVLLAWYLDRVGDQLHFGRVLVALVVTALPTSLILLQPDLGTMMVLVVVAAGMITIAGAAPRHLAVLTALALASLTWILTSDVLATYQRDRLTSFVGLGDQTTSYNLDQSEIAVASGGALGKGWGQGPQTQNGFVPEQQTDFIFTVVAEELGFLGSAILLGIFAVLILRMLRVAQLARDTFGSLICVGVVVMIAFQVFQNVGMSIGIMPITGIPLPFLSYGGSSLLTSFAAVGLVLNVHMRRFV